MNLSDNEFQVSGKTLNSYRYDTTLQAFVTESVTEVPHNSWQAYTNFGEIVSTANEGNSAKSKKTVLTVATDAQGEPAFFSLNGSSYYGADELYKYSARVEKAYQTIRANTGHPEEPFNVITAAIEGIDTGHSRKETIRASSFEELVSYQRDEDGVMWKYTSRVVTPDYVPSEGVSEQQGVDTRHAIQTVKTYSSLSSDSIRRENSEVCLDEITTTTVETAPVYTKAPGVEKSYRYDSATERYIVKTTVLNGWATYSRTWWEVDEVVYPNIFPGFAGGDLTTLFLNQHRKTAFTVNYSQLKASKSVACRFKHVETLVASNSKASVANCFSFKPVDWNYNGALFDISLNNVLTNSTAVVASTNSDDTYFGYGAEQVSLPASSPTYTAFMAMIGNETEVLYSIKTVPFRFCLFKVITTYVVFSPP